MDSRLSLNWSALAIRGVIAIVFGVLAFLMPGLTLGALILLFAAYAIVDGVSHVVTGIRQRSGERPDGLMILGGVVGIAVGVVAAILPGITALFLLALIGAWAIVTGAAEIFAAYRLRKAIRGEWLLALDGIISIAFGLYVWIFPGAGALAIVWLIAAFAIASGVILLMLAFRMRSLARGTGATFTRVARRVAPDGMARPIGSTDVRCRNDRERRGPRDSSNGRSFIDRHGRARVQRRTFRERQVRQLGTGAGRDHRRGRRRSEAAGSASGRQPEGKDYWCAHRRRGSRCGNPRTDLHDRRLPHPVLVGTDDRHHRKWRSEHHHPWRE